MTELGPKQRAGITKRNNARNAFLDAAESVFTDSSYRDVTVERVASHALISVPTFYSMFSGKNSWAAAVLDKRLNEALYQPETTEAGTPRGPHARLLGHFGLLAQVSAPLPGITKALIDERTDTQAAYGDLVPRYHGDVTQAFADGQEQHVFRSDMPPASLADFALDSIALAYAVHLDNPAARAKTTSLLLDGLQAEA
jgi:AcrR family transcriptional regulator